MKFLILLALVAFVAAMDDDHKKIYKEWKNHVEKYNRKYHNDDHARKGFENFARTYAQVQEHNRRFRAGVETFEAGFNQFSDMNEEERAKYNGLNVVPSLPFHVNKRNIDTTIQWRSTSGTIYKQIIGDANLPTSVDYCKFTGTVRDQGQCGSCYSFASNKVIEMNLRKKFNITANLGPQHVVDCSAAFGNNGCNGGFITNVLDYLMNAGGCLIDETTYPYKAAVQPMTADQCKAMCAGSKIKAKVTGYVVAKPNDLAAVKTLLNQGPCFAAIYVSPNSPLYTYKSGIINDPSIGDPNHAVVAVGYGSANGTEYIRILNSWASTWGSNGYANIPVNQIQILSNIFYPNITTIA